MAVGQISAQNAPDSLNTEADRQNQPKDTLSVVTDTVALSKDSLDAPVEYTASDSMRYDILNKQIHLYGDAHVSYSSINLEADYIIFDWENNTVTASGRPDSSGTIQGNPVFREGDQEFQARRMRYNFKTQKGITYQTTSMQNDVFVRGEKAKFVAAAKSADSTRTNDVIYSKNAIFTSCSHPEPHYGIRSSKQKVIPNKTVVVGPSNLEIAGVPTPLYLPFGFFPVTPSATAGLIVPDNYEYDPRFGFGLSNIGYFTPIGEHFNLSLTTDIYFKKRWGVHARSQYKKRYKYNGNFNLSFSTFPEELSDGSLSRNDAYILQWTHNQEPNAHPTINFGGQINIQTNNYQRNFQNSWEDVSNNTLNSNLNFTFTPREKPWNMSAAFNHSQNNRTRLVTINFPNLNFQTQTLNPFKRKNAPGPPKWYENIALRYRADARNKLESTDTTLFSGNLLDKLQYGVKQSVNSNVTFNVLKYFRLSPSVNYDETWYFQTLEKDFDPNVYTVEIDTTYNPQDSSDFTVSRDTTSFGIQSIDTLTGFKAFRRFSSSMSVNFDVFGTLLFKKGWLRGVRHYMKPSFSLNYSPDYTDPRFGYVRTVDTDARDAFNEEESYDVFLNNGVFGRPNISGEQFSIGYSLTNILQGKSFSKKDSTIQYFNFFDNIRLNGSYNIAADSLNWSQVNISGQTNLIKNFLNIRFTARFDPYITNEDGRRINKLAWKEKGRPLEFVNFRMPFSNTFSVKKLRALFAGKADEAPPSDEELEDRKTKEPIAQDFWKLFDNFTLSHNIVFDLSKIDGKDTLRITTNSLQLRGSVQISKNWRISLDNLSYDFRSKQLVYPSFSFYRDLHCWEMSLGWQPQRGTYSFALKVKPGTLDFLEVPYQRRNVGRFSGF